MSEAAEAAKKVYPISVVVNAQASANKGNWVQFVVQLHDNNDIEIHRDNKLVFCGAKETLEELAEATQAMLAEVKKRARLEKEARTRREVYLEANQIAIRLTQQTGPPKKIGRPRAI